jgi:hypothetical protein
LCVSPVFARVEVRMFRVLTSATEHERSGGAYARARHLHCCSRAGSCPTGSSRGTLPVTQSVSMAAATRCDARMMTGG